MKKPYAAVLDQSTSLQNKTGSWRTLKPKYVSKIPPCNMTCPAGENIQKWLSFAQEGKFFEAWEEMTKNNPFPAIMGRVCYHTCELACNRKQFDGAVNINLIERAIGDFAIKNCWRFENSSTNSGKRVLIIGAGPAGLSAAYFLRKFGHDITIYDSHTKPGGTMRYGIPRYRLPTKVLDAEIQRIIDLGVTIVTNKYVNNLKEEADKFDAVFIATGACRAVQTSVTTQVGALTIDAIDFLTRLEENRQSIPELGNNVIVYGGGNTSIDAARSARRLGAEKVSIIYRRNMENMPAHKSEVEEAIAEGVEVLCLRTIETIEKGRVLINKMRIDEDGNLVKADETEYLRADSVIFAIGQSIDEGIFSNLDNIKLSGKGTIEVASDFMTGEKGIFAGGDIIPGKRTVTDAIGSGKKAAKYIDAYLRGQQYVPAKNFDIAAFNKINTDYFRKLPKTEISRLGELDFTEKDISYNEKETVFEASRCFSCGNCFHCDNCYAYCPDNAIIKHEDGTLEFNYDYCKGCGICAQECPCGSIKMELDE